MDGKKAAAIIVALILIASVAVVISITIFFKTYKPKTEKTELHESSAAIIETSSHLIH